MPTATPHPAKALGHRRHPHVLYLMMATLPGLPTASLANQVGPGPDAQWPWAAAFSLTWGLVFKAELWTSLVASGQEGLRFHWWGLASPRQGS